MPIREENYEMKYHIAYAEELLEAIADSVVPLEKKKECPICGAKFNVFLPFGVRIRKNAECPHCHSLERHRALWLLLEERRLFAGGWNGASFCPGKSVL